MSTDDPTTIALKRQTKQRFDKSKPYKSLSADEFVDELLDAYDGGADE